MEHRASARAGLAALALANVVFAFAGADRGGIYVFLQLASVALAVAGWSCTPAALATTIGGLGGVRVVTMALDLSRLPFWLNASLAIVAFAGAAALATRRRPLARLAVWGLALGYFLAMVTSVSGGSIYSTIGIMLVAVAYSLIAPNL